MYTFAALKRLSTAVAVVVGIVGTSGAGAAAQPPPHSSATILVKFASSQAAANLIAAHGDRSLATTPLGVHVVKLGAGAGVAAEVASYASERGVVYAEPNYIANAALAVPNDPSYAADWGMDKVRAVEGWTAYPGSYATSGGAPVAIVDTGVQSTHPDLSGRVDTTAGADCTGSANTCIAGSAGDDNGHGTHVAGIAGAATNNGTGVAGIAFSSRLIPVKVLNSSGSGTYASIANGINWAVSKGARVINMSLGGTGYSQTLCDAVAAAVQSGVVVVAAAGNSDSSVASYPAACPGAIGVAATDSSDARAGYSNFGAPNVFVSAPGSSIYSTYYNSAYATLSGTSMASPFVAGLAALLVGQVPTRTPGDVKQLLATTSDKVGGATYGSDPYGTCSGCTWNADFGYGRIDAARALGVAAPPPPPPPGSTVTATPVASGDDGTVAQTGVTYPPSAGTSANTNGVVTVGRRSVHTGFEVYDGLVRFDTSAIPDDATITGASLRIYVTAKADGDNRNLVAEWYDTSNWPIDGADYALNPASTALSGADVTQLVTNASNTFALTGLASVSKTGYTGIRLGLDGGQPTADNYVQFASFDGTQPKPQLVVTYTTSSPPPPPSTLTAAPSAAGDDGTTALTGSVYPPTGTPSASVDGVAVTAGRRLVHTGFEVYDGLVRFDTSAIPDTATITGATLRLYVTGKSDGDNRNLVAEWYDPAKWPLDGSDFTLNPGSSAFAADITQLAVGATDTFNLAGATSISKTGFTALRLGIDGGQPAGDNYVQFAAFDHPSLPEAQLVVTFQP